MPDRMTEWLAVKTDALQLGQTPCRNSRGAPEGVAPWKDWADFAAGTSIRTSHWVLSVVLVSKLRLCSRNCSWWFPQGSTSEPCKLLNLLMPK
jgi:hypothetical protein